MPVLGGGVLIDIGRESIAEITFKMKNLGLVCCDPYEVHKKNITSGVNLLPINVYRHCHRQGFHIEKNAPICVNCLKRLQNHGKNFSSMRIPNSEWDQNHGKFIETLMKPAEDEGLETESNAHSVVDDVVAEKVRESVMVTKLMVDENEKKLQIESVGATPVAADRYDEQDEKERGKKNLCSDSAPASQDYKRTTDLPNTIISVTPDEDSIEQRNVLLRLEKSNKDFTGISQGQSKESEINEGYLPSKNHQSPRQLEDGQQNITSDAHSMPEISDAPSNVSSSENFGNIESLSRVQSTMSKSSAPLQSSQSKVQSSNNRDSNMVYLSKNEYPNMVQSYDKDSNMVQSSNDKNSNMVHLSKNKGPNMVQSSNDKDLDVVQSSNDKDSDVVQSSKSKDSNVMTSSKSAVDLNVALVCCNPFKTHKKVITSGVSKLPLSTFLEFQRKGINLNRDSPICLNCVTKCQRQGREKVITEVVSVKKKTNIFPETLVSVREKSTNFILVPEPMNSLKKNTDLIAENVASVKKITDFIPETSNSVKKNMKLASDPMTSLMPEALNSVKNYLDLKLEASKFVEKNTDLKPKDVSVKKNITETAVFTMKNTDLKPGKTIPESNLEENNQDFNSKDKITDTIPKQKVDLSESIVLNPDEENTILYSNTEDTILYPHSESTILYHSPEDTVSKSHPKQTQSSPNAKEIIKAYPQRKRSDPVKREIESNSSSVDNFTESKPAKISKKVTIPKENGINNTKSITSSQKETKCCSDPFKTHKKNITSGLCKIPNKLHQKCQDLGMDVSANPPVCVNCLKKIHAAGRDGTQQSTLRTSQTDCGLSITGKLYDELLPNDDNEADCALSDRETCSPLKRKRSSGNPPDSFPNIEREIKSRKISRHVVSSVKSAMNGTSAATLERGALIVLEGCDRTGKTTQAQKLVESLKTKGKPAIFMRFPDRSTKIGGIINSYLSCSSDLEDHSIHLLFSANRWESLPKIMSTLQSGTSIIIDRYAFSGVAFSAAKEGLSLEWCKQSDVGLPKPDAVLFFDLSTEEAQRRAQYGEERYEKVDIQQRVYANYKLLKDDSWKMIDANKTIDELQEILVKEALQVVDNVNGTEIGKLWV